MLHALGRRQWVSGEDPVLDGFILLEMLLHKARHALGGHAVVPGAFGVDNHGRPVAADPQAAHLRAIAGIRPGGEACVFECLLQRFPGGLALLRRATTWPRAQEDMPLIMADAVLGRRRVEFAL